MVRVAPSPVEAELEQENAELPATAEAITHSGPALSDAQVLNSNAEADDRATSPTLFERQPSYDPTAAEEPGVSKTELLGSNGPVLSSGTESETSDPNPRMETLSNVSEVGWKDPSIAKLIQSSNSMTDKESTDSKAAHWQQVRAMVVTQGLQERRRSSFGTEENIILSHDSTEEDFLKDVGELTRLKSHPQPAVLRSQNPYLKSCLKRAVSASTVAPLDASEEAERQDGESVMGFAQAKQMLSPKKRVKFNLKQKNGVLLRLPKIRPSTDPTIERWNFFFIVPLAYETWAFPYRLALGNPGFSVRFILDCICDFWFVLDACVTMIVEVPDQPWLGRSDLIWRYWKKVFPSQLFPSIIFVFLSCNESTPYWLWWLAGIPRLVPRLTRLLRYFNTMEMNLDVDVDKLQLVKFSGVIFLSCHWIGSLYYWIARLLKFADNTWIGQFELTMPGVFDRSESEDSVGRYIALLYRGWIGLAPNSYRKPPQNWQEQLFSVLVMFIAMYLSAYLIGTVLPYIVKRDPVAEANAQKLSDFNAFAQQKHLPPDLVNRVLTYFQFQNAKAGELSSELENIKLTKSLEVKVARKKFGPYLQKCSVRGQPFFKCDQNFLSALVTILREVFLMPGEEFIRSGEVSRDLYFVADGTVQICDGDNVVKEIRGDVPTMPCIVGETSFILGVPTVHSARAKPDGDVKLLVLTREASEKLLNQYPEQQELIFRNILQTWDLDMRGNDLGSSSSEEEKDSRKDQKLAIVSAIKRRERENFADLNFAASIGDTQEVRRLIRRGADLSGVDYDGRTILHMACAEGNIRVVELLLQHGAQKNAKSRFGTTPIMEAIYARQTQIVHILLKEGAEMLLDDASSLLCDWASKGDTDNLKLLLDNSIDPNIGDYDNRMPLHLAASEGHDKVVELLLQHDADVNVRDRWGGTPMKDAVVSGHSSVASILRNKGGVLPEGVGAAEFCAAASQGDVARLRMLHACGVNPNEGDYDLRSPLHLAASEARLLVVSFLLGVSARVNAKDRWGGTALDDCVRGGTLYHKLCGRLLLGWGGELGKLKDSEEGLEAVKDMSLVAMDRVSDLIERLIASGLNESRRNKLSDQDLQVRMDATLRLIVQCSRIESELQPCIDTFLAVASQLQKFSDRVIELMRAFAELEDISSESDFHAILHLAGQGRQKPSAAQKKMSFAASAEIQVVPRIKGGVKQVQSVETFLSSIDKENLDPDVLMEDCLDDETLRMYEELDILVHQQERTLGLAVSGRAGLAKGLNRFLMQIYEVEEMLQKLKQVFRKAADQISGQSFGLEDVMQPLTAQTLQLAMQLLGVEGEDKVVFEEMLQEASNWQREKIGSLTVEDLLCQSFTFRSMLNLMDHFDQGTDSKIGLLRRIAEFRRLHLSFLVDVTAGSDVASIPVGHKILQAGVAPQAMYIVKNGEFQAELKRNNKEVTILGNLIEGSKVGAFEFFTGQPMRFSVKASTEAEVIVIKQQQLAAYFQQHPNMMRAVAKVLAEESDNLQSCPVYSTVGFVKRFKGRGKHWTESEILAVTSSMAETFGIKTADDHFATEEPDLILQDLAPGLRIVQDSWQSFSFGAAKLDSQDFEGIDEFLGEVGTGFVEKLHKVLAESREIDIGHWWRCWVSYLESTGSEDSQQNQDIFEAQEEILTMTKLELMQSSLRRKKLRAMMLDETVAPKYEAAYIVVVGKLSEPLTSHLYRKFLSSLFPHETVDKIFVYVFLNLFGRDGQHSKKISWSWMRKIILEKGKSDGMEHEPFFMPGSTVFNPLAKGMQTWFLVARLVALYHFLVVPIRLTYRPFTSINQIEALCTDLVFDVLMLVHVAISFNTAYINKKSRWVTDRLKIFKKYLSNGFYLDFISAMPLDWIQVTMGMPMRIAEWTRLLKMLFVRVIFAGFAFSNQKPQGMLQIFMTAFFVLHLSACLWSAMGLSPNFPTSLGTSWLFAESAQEFISGVHGPDRELSMWELYCISLNWVATHTVSSIGNTTLYPKNYQEILFAILQLTVGMTFYRMRLSQISSFVMKSHGKIIKVRAELRSLVNYIQTNKLGDDEQLTGEIRQHFHALQHMQSIDMSAVFDNLNHGLQFEMARHICRDCLDTTELFKGCSQQMLDRVSVIMREVTFAPEEEVFQAGDVSDELYIVVGGALEKFQTDSFGQESSMGKIRTNETAGEVSFSFGMKHLYTAKASADLGATCFKIARSNYVQILKLYPEDKDTVAENSLICFEKAKNEHSQAGSRRGTSVQADDANKLAMEVLDDDLEERSIKSQELDSAYFLDAATEFEHMIGTGIAAQISALKSRHDQGRVMQLLDAAAAGDVSRLRALLKRGVEVNNSDKNKRTALHVACSEGNVEACKFLLEAKADIEAKDFQSHTPLDDAVREKRDEVCSLIRTIVPDCFVSWSISTGAVFLCDAAFKGDMAQLKRLVFNGVSVNAADYDNRTALHLASCEGHSEIVEYLLDSGAKVNARDRFSSTALQDAVRHRQVKVQRLLKNAGGQLIGMDTAVSMCEAAAKGDLEFLKTLIENGVDANLPDYDNRTALHLAASNGKLEVLNYLVGLEPAIVLSPVDIQGGTPLDDAVRHDQKIAEQLLEMYGGLRDGDPNLGALQEEQQALNRAQAKAARTPQVEIAVNSSLEMTHMPSLMKLEFALFGRQALSIAEAEPGAQVLLSSGASAPKDFTRNPSDGVQTADGVCLLERIDNLRANSTALILKFDKILAVFKRLLPRNRSAASSTQHSALSGGANSVSTQHSALSTQQQEAATSGLTDPANFNSEALEADGGAPRPLSPSAPQPLSPSAPQPQTLSQGFESEAILPALLRGVDSLVELLGQAYRSLPSGAEIEKVNKVCHCKYTKARRQFLQELLYLIALAQHLRHMARLYQGSKMA